RETCGDTQLTGDACVIASCRACGSEHRRWSNTVAPSAIHQTRVYALPHELGPSRIARIRGMVAVLPQQLGPAGHLLAARLVEINEHYAVLTCLPRQSLVEHRRLATDQISLPAPGKSGGHRKVGEQIDDYQRGCLMP